MMLQLNLLYKQLITTLTPRQQLLRLLQLQPLKVIENICIELNTVTVLLLEDATEFS